MFDIFQFIQVTVENRSKAHFGKNFVLNIDIIFCYAFTCLCVDLGWGAGIMLPIKKVECWGYCNNYNHLII